MYSFRKPSQEMLHTLLKSQQGLKLIYREVGATRDLQKPQGFVIDQTRAKLGEGAEVFEAAKSALKRWRQYRFSWLEAWPDDAPIRAGNEIATIARLLGLWWVNVCRIVYTIDEPTRFGYAYGTLPEHVECGEERFLIELTKTGEVWYDIYAFSRPQSWLSRIGYPYVRRVQKLFGQNSVAALRIAIQEQRLVKQVNRPR
jgi:uncharacterized protein (UPF0548 family)